jgi:hypothetical protein
MSRWCDRSIHDTGHSEKANGPLAGRLSVWNSCRGNHLGQRSCASASTGRTYGRKRSDQNTDQHLARRGPSTYGFTCARRPTGLSRSAASPNSSTGTTDDARIRRSAGKHRTRPISARSHRLRQRRRNAMADGSCECVDSRLRRYPPDRAIAVPYGQAGEKPCVSLTLPTGRRLPTSFTVPPHQQGLILIPGKVKPSTGYEP